MKKAKRHNQADECYRVLSLVRAEIKRRENALARKNANVHLSRTLSGTREILSTIATEFSEGGSISTSVAINAAANCNTLLHSSRIPETAKTKLRLLREGFDAVANDMRREDEARAMREKEEKIAAWLRGERSDRYSLYGIPYTLIRARNVERDESGAITGGTLETSQGAEVPLTHAIRAFRFIKLVRDRGEAWNRNGHSLRVGHFGVDSIATSGDFKAGCHSIRWSEVERLARELGVFDASASDEAISETHVAA